MKEAARDKWLPLCIECMTADESINKWCADRGLSSKAMGNWLRRFTRENPELFVETKLFRACEVSAVCAKYKDEQTRTFLRLAYYKLSRVEDRLGGNKGKSRHEMDRGKAVFKEMVALMPEDFLACDATDGWLQELAEALSSNPKAAKYISEVVLLMRQTGFRSQNSGYVAWLESHEALIAKASYPSAIILAALRNDGYLGMELALTRGKQGERVTTLYVDAKFAFCRKLLVDFCETQDVDSSYRNMEFFSWFVESLGFEPQSLTDFSPDTFDRQLRWFEGRPSRHPSSIKTQVCRFYYYVISRLPSEQDTFTLRTGVTAELLSTHDFALKWLSGYRAVVLNSLDQPPQHCKWLIIRGMEDSRKSSMRQGQTIGIDLTVHECCQKTFLEWAWFNVSVTTVSAATAAVKALIAEITASSLTLSAKGGRSLVVDSSMVMRAFTAHSAHKASTQRAADKRYMRTFLEYGVSKNVLNVEESCFLHLQNTPAERRKPVSSAEAASLEDMSALAAELEKRASHSTENELVFIAFCVLAMTRLRLGEILNLENSSFITGPHDGICAVRLSTKTDGEGLRDVQIPKLAYSLLRRAVELTEHLRETSSPKMSECVFLVTPSVAGLDGAAVLSRERFLRHIKAACQDAGIEVCLPRSVRKRYMTEAMSEAARKNIERMAERSLTGHSRNATTFVHYYRPDIREYLEATHGVAIGNPKMMGNVLEDKELEGFTEEDLVTEEFGFCRNEACDIAGTVTCLMCSGFVTSPRFISEMKEAVGTLKRQIGSAQTMHDREHLQSVLSLYLAYLAEMMTRKEENG